MKLTLKLLTTTTLCLMSFYGQAATLSSVKVACSTPTSQFLSESLTCTATAYYADGTNKVVTATPTTSWSIATTTPTTFSSVLGTTFSTINQSGKVTKNPGPKNYSFTVQAVYKEGTVTQKGVSSSLTINGIDGQLASKDPICQATALLVSKLNAGSLGVLSAYYSKSCHAKWIVSSISPTNTQFGRFNYPTIFVKTSTTVINSKMLYSDGLSDEVFVNDGISNIFSF